MQEFDGKMPPLQDRRTFARFEIDLPAKLLSWQKDFLLDVSLKDISGVGAKVNSREKLIPTSEVEMWIRLPEKQKPVHLKGKVVWLRPKDKDSWDAGISLEQSRLLEVQRIFNYV